MIRTRGTRYRDPPKYVDASMVQPVERDGMFKSGRNMINVENEPGYHSPTRTKMSRYTERRDTMPYLG